MKKAKTRLIALVLVWALLMSGCSLLNRYALEHYALADTPEVYNLTELVQTEDTLLACAMYDETRVFYLALTEEQGQRQFAARLLSLEDGTIEELYRWSPAGESAVTASGIGLMSLQPLVVYDAAADMVYTLEDTSSCHRLDVSGLDGSLSYIDGQLYTVQWDGYLYRIHPDGSAELAWTLPEEYSGMSYEWEKTEGVATFASSSLYDLSETVYLDVTLSDGSYSAYTADLMEFYPDVVENQEFCTVSLANTPTLECYNNATASVTTLTLPEEVIEALSLYAEYAYDEEDASASAEAQTYSWYTLGWHPIAGNYMVFALTDDTQLTSIYLWDRSQTPSQPWTPPQETAYYRKKESYDELSQRAAALGERYGITVEIGANIMTDLPDYTAEVEDHVISISVALDTLENTLESYPENYFPQLMEGMYRGMCFYLTGEMTPKDPTQNIQSPGALTCTSDGLEIIAIDINGGMNRGNVFHELAHVLDNKLIRDGLLDENVWSSFNPDGFAYYYSYIDSNGDSYADTGSDDYTNNSDAYLYSGDANYVYFYDSYSKTFPTEDRARSLEILMREEGYVERCFASTHLQQKLSYYFDLIRQDFDTTGWPEQTAWEQALNSVKG